MVQVKGEAGKFIKQIACQNCDALLEYKNADVHTVHSKDYGHGVDVREYIICPRCNNEVTVNHY